MLTIIYSKVSVCLWLESFSLYFKHITNQLLQILDDRASCNEANSTDIVLSFVGEMFSRICRRGLSGIYIYAPSISLLNLLYSFFVDFELPLTCLYSRFVPCNGWVRRMSSLQIGERICYNNIFSTDGVTMCFLLELFQ